MGTPHFARKTQLSDLTSLQVGGSAALDLYPALYERLHDRFGRDAAELFAEPVVTHGNGPAPTSVSWYAPVAGDPQRLTALDAASRQAAEADLKRRLAAVEPALSDPEIGPLVRSALYVSSVDDVLVVGGQSLLTNWGLVPRGTLDDPASRQRHFETTLGPFAPFPAPVPGDSSDTVPASGAGPGAGTAAAGAMAAGGALVGGTAAGALAAGPGGPGGGLGGSGGGFGGGSGAGGGAGMDGGGPLGPPVVVEERPRRPWLPVLIAAIVTGLVLLALLLPGVLLYPPEPAAEQEPDLDALIALQQEANRTLEEEIRNSERLLDAGICRAEDSTLILPEGLNITPGGVAPGSTPVPGLDPGAPGSGIVNPGLTDPGTGTGPGDSSALTPGALSPGTLSPSSILPPRPEATRVTPAAREGLDPFEGTLVDLLDASTALVIARRAEELGIGSGFFIAPGLLLTSLHVVEGTTPDGLFVTNRVLGQVRPARIVHRTAQSTIGGADFAVLALDGAEDVPLLGLTTAVGRLDDVVAAGYPTIVLESDLNFQALMNGDRSAIPEMALTQGVVTVVQNLSDQYPVIAHTAAISPGNSGGPLVDECGRVVGMNTFLRVDQRRATRMNYAIVADSLMRFLDENGVGYARSDGPCAPEPVARSSAGESAEPPAAAGAASEDPAAPEAGSATDPDASAGEPDPEPAPEAQ